MANWSEILEQWNKYSPAKQNEWIWNEFRNNFSNVSDALEGANILFYFSAFLQKPTIDPASTQMMGEDINGVMNALYGMDFNKNLAVILHTPGGDLSAVETITEYIHSKFKEVTVIVPVMSMSAGTMFALSCDKIIISKAGQLGPTDPQIIMSSGAFSVKEIIAQFNKARDDILENIDAARVWAPILQTYGPALHEQSSKIEEYAITVIKKWLKNKNRDDSSINNIVEIFHDSPNFHGQRIGYNDLQNLGLNVSLLEDSQTLQNSVMGLYHLATIHAENSPMTKMIMSNKMQSWVKNYNRQ